MTRRQKLLPWLIGILIASLLMGSLALFAGLQYAGNDDTPLLRTTMGYEGGEPATFHLHMHAAFTWLFYGLAKLFPGVAWLSIVQLFLLWFTQVVIVKSLCSLALLKGMPMWTGAVIGALFLSAFCLYISCRITYTVTAALCGAASVACLSSVDFSAERRQVILGVSGSAALLLCCYFLRMSAALPAVCFWVLLFAIRFFPVRKRYLLVLLGAIALVFVSAMGIQLWNTRAQGAQADVQWHRQRIALFDYAGFPAEVPDEMLSDIGWSRDELALIENWFFLNDNITAKAFETLADQQTAAGAALPLRKRLDAAWQTFINLITADAKLRVALYCLLLAALAAALRGTSYTFSTLLMTLLGGLAMLYLLGYMGRLNARAAYAVLLPAGVICYASFFDAKGIPQQQMASVTMAIAMAVCIVLTAYIGVIQVNDAEVAPDPALTDTTSDLHADLDELALMNEDMLIVYDLSLSLDQRLFPDTSEGVPGNLMLWGGWTAHTPGWRQMLERFGITTLDPSLFLRDNVLYASTYAQPTQALMNYIGEATDQTVDWLYYDQWGYVNLFEFDAY